MFQVWTCYWNKPLLYSVYICSCPLSLPNVVPSLTTTSGWCRLPSSAVQHTGRVVLMHNYNRQQFHFVLNITTSNFVTMANWKAVSPADHLHIRIQYVICNCASSGLHMQGGWQLSPAYHDQPHMENRGNITRFSMSNLTVQAKWITKLLFSFLLSYPKKEIEADQIWF